MKTRASLRGVGVLSTALVSSLLALAAGACGDDDQDDSVAVTADAAGEAETGTQVGERDAFVPPADASVEADADGEAAAPTCSVEGFCHTALPPAQTLRGVWGDGLGVAWAVSEQGSVLRWNGSSWSIAHTAPGKLFAIWGSGPTDLWAAGESGVIHGGGATSSAIVWTPVLLPGNATIPILSLWGTGPTDLWAVGSTPTPFGEARVGRVLHFTGSGAQPWSVDPISSLPMAFLDVWGTSGTDVWIGGDKGTGFSKVGAVLRRTSGDGGAEAGASFREIALPTDPQTHDGELAIFTAGGATTTNDVWVFGRSNATLPTAWRGTRGDGGVFDWTVQTTQSSDKLVWDVWGTSRNDAWSAGEYGGLRHWDGSTWAQSRITVTSYPITSTFHAAWGDGKGELWFVGDGIALHKTAAAKP